MTKKNENYPKILVYTHTPRAFRTTLIGYLYEIAQHYPVILLSEELDSKTEAIIKNKKLFPKLQEILPVRQFTGENRNLFSKNNYLCKLAKRVINQYKPDIVISESDNDSLFELYLMRFAKEINAIRITIQCTISTAPMEQIAKWVDLINLHSRTPNFLPFWLRLLFIKARKYFGHYLYYWILPLLAGQLPFFGKPSFVLYRGQTGMRNSEYNIVFSKQEQDILFHAGVPKKRLFLLAHPLARKTRKIFEIAYFGKGKKHKKSLLFLLPEEKIGFRKKDYSLISKKERQELRTDIVNLAADTLPDWNIFVKPHPNIKNIGETRNDFESISNNVKVTEPTEPTDEYIENCDAIIELPRSASTAVFTALLQCPEKPIFCLDFDHEFLGDYYKNYPGVKYVDDKEKFVSMLKKIKNGTFSRKASFVNVSGKKTFCDIIGIINFLQSKQKKVA